MLDERSIQIRVATQADCEEIAGLQHLCHTISFRTFAEPDWIKARSLEEYLSFWCDYLPVQPAHDRTWVACLDRVTVGTVTIMSLEHSSDHFAPAEETDGSNGEVACLRLMYVHPEYQRSGIGSQLMAFVMKFIEDQGYRIATLITHAENHVARRFYERAGWKLDAIFEGQVEEFFKDPPAMRRRARYLLTLD